MIYKITKYNNRSLFSHSHRRVVTLNEIRDLICAGHVIEITRHSDQEDITRHTLLSIIASQEPEKSEQGGILTELTLQNLIRFRSMFPQHHIDQLNYFLAWLPLSSRSRLNQD